MSGSLQIARLFGIPVRIHWTFSLIFVWVLYVGQSSYGHFNWEVIAWTTASIMALFACVILHELGHALAARRFGVNTRNILLLPIGGLAVLDRLPEKPFHEFLVALAGPAVNVMLAIGFSPLLFLVPFERRARIFSYIMQEPNVFLRDITYFDGFLFGLVVLNLLVAVFNLLPAFPMDGGRILRSLLSMRMERVKATRFAAFLGQFLAVLLVIFGLFNENYAAAIIGAFIFFTASNEYRSIRNESLLKQFKVKDIFRPVFTKLYLGDPLGLAVDQLWRGMEKHFLIFDEWQNLAGILPESRIVQAMKKGVSPQKQVNKVMKEEFIKLGPEEALHDVLSTMQRQGMDILPVYDRGKLLGVVDIDGVEHFLQLQQRVNGRKGRKNE